MDGDIMPNNDVKARNFQGNSVRCNKMYYICIFLPINTLAPERM